uniref:Poly [ADP-ribose] polymerase n=1 Tax=Macrostomum lignano TaxID=282301 RepID=A0A1I8GHB1_9PLAT
DIEASLDEGEDLLSAAAVTAEQMMQRNTCPFRVGRQHLQLVQSWSMLNRYRRNCDQSQTRGIWQSETELRDGSENRDDWSESDRERRYGGKRHHNARRDNNCESRSAWRDPSRELSNSQDDLRRWAETGNEESNRNRNGRVDGGRRNNRREYRRRRGYCKEQQKVRNFNCGHWEPLDFETSSRLVSNEFCSKCWPLTAQMQRNGLFSRPRDDDQVKRTMLWDTDSENSLEYIQVLDRVTRYVKWEHNIKVRILTIEKIENPVLDRRVYHVYDQLIKKNSEPLLLIHGTTGDVAERILQEGFQVSKFGTY